MLQTKSIEQIQRILDQNEAEIYRKSIFTRELTMKKIVLDQKAARVIFLIFFLLGSIGLFYLEITISSPVTERERGLFNALEFGLAIGIGWQFQRIASEEEFRENLKQFALSAYRRIKDIDKSVLRINNEISQMRSSYSSEKTHELDVLRTLTEVTNFTIQSSIADWSDLIGEEVRKQEKLEELQKEEQELLIKRRFSGDPTISKRLNDLTQEISKLRSDIPYMLQYDLQRSGEFQQSKIAAVFSEKAYAYLYDTIEKSSILSLYIKPNPQLPDEKIEKLGEYKSSIFIRADYSGIDYSLKLYGKNGYLIGVVENPLIESGVSNNDFAHTLIQMLGLITELTDTLSAFPILPSNFVLENVNYIINKEISPPELKLEISIPRRVSFGWG